MGQIVLIDASTDVLIDSEDAEDQHALSSTTEPSGGWPAKYSKIWAISAICISAIVLIIMVCVLVAATTTVDIRLTTHRGSTMADFKRPASEGQLLRNEIYGHCVSFHETPTQDDMERNFTTWAMGVPSYDGSALVLTTGICDEDPSVVRFRADPSLHNIKSTDNRCLVPLSPVSPIV